MPEVRNYIVTQTRTVQVSANTPAGAVLIAQSQFNEPSHNENGTDPEVEFVWGHATSRVRTVSTEVKER